MTKVSIVSKNQDQDNPEENDKEDVSTDLVSYTEAVSATLHTTTRCGYIDRHDVYAAPAENRISRFSSICKKKITDLVSTTKSALFILIYKFNCFFEIRNKH
ncbi:hypothetical protein AVEN_123724-1 [Araneus ventricosus]|uniref:Uncharacterized protein n=1 Tax=Araneus ventricosus TaxID=182803 RepID=A0A4Y2K5Z5_ARAVE|nr:hypothetical protein AVEN_123724-1 [Araneus ventricosus]